jgi:FkbM family methyltransferase
MNIGAIAKLSRAEGEAMIRAQCTSHYLGGHEALCRVLGRYKMFVDTRDCALAPHLLMDGYWEYWITKFVVDSVKRGMVVFDIGANVGYYTLLLADLVGEEGKCVAFEPNPNLADKLRRSVAINGFAERCSVEQMAVGRNGVSSSELIIPNNNFGGAYVRAQSANGNGGGVSVPTVSLDSFCSALCALDFVKIDAEGAEPDILVGMQDTLDRLRPSLLLEFSAGHGRSLLEQLLAFYGSISFVDYDGFAKPVSADTLLSAERERIWMLYCAGRAWSSVRLRAHAKI